MFTDKELKTALDYLDNEAKRYEALRIRESIESEILYCLVTDEIENDYFRLTIDELKKTLKFTFNRVLRTYGIIPTWLRVGHILVVKRLYRELNGKED